MGASRRAAVPDRPSGVGAVAEARVRRGRGGDAPDRGARRRRRPAPARAGDRGLKYVVGFLEHLERMSPWEYQEVRRALGSRLGLRLARLPPRQARLAAAARGVPRAAARAGAVAARGLHAGPRARGSLPARRAPDGLGRAGRHLALPAREDGGPHHRRGRRRDAGHAGRAARRPDQEQAVPGALARAHRADGAGEAVGLISLSEIQRARERLGDAVRATPLVPLDVDAPCEILLKLECLQPIGSFKLRGGLSAVRAATRDELAHGVVTASAGNMAQGVAWAAREAGVPATIVAPDTAPRTKLDAVERLGGRVIRVPHEVWWQTMLDRGHPEAQGLFIHPVADHGGDRRQRDDRARAVRGARRVRHGRHPVGRRRPDDGDRECREGVSAGRAGGHRGARDCGAAHRVLRRRRAGRDRLRSRRSSTAPAGGRCCPACGSTRRSWSTRRWRCRSSEVAAAVRLLAGRARVVAEGAGALSRGRSAVGRRRQRPRGVHRQRRQHRRRSAVANTRAA